MRRADRLFQIVQYLRGGRLVRARDLAERLEVSERTIYRDMADLIGSGVPIEGEAGIGYVMRSGYDVPPLMFTREEVTALVAGLRMAQVWGGAEMGQAAEEALVKIEAVLPDSLRERAGRVPIHAMSFLGLEPVDRANLDRIEAATEAHQRLVLTYADEAGTRSARTIRPLALLFWGRAWTVAAWCELREDFRMFRVDRIENLETGPPFRMERGKDLTAFYTQQRGRPIKPGRT